MDFQDNNEVFSVKLATKFRLFYLDLKKSAQGFFVKVSEKSAKAGRSTIMFDAEDLDDMINALTQIRDKVKAEGGATSGGARPPREQDAPKAPEGDAPAETASAEPKEGGDAPAGGSGDLDMDSELA